MILKSHLINRALHIAAFALLGVSISLALRPVPNSALTRRLHKAEARCRRRLPAGRRPFEELPAVHHNNFLNRRAIDDMERRARIREEMRPEIEAHRRKRPVRKIDTSEAGDARWHRGTEERKRLRDWRERERDARDKVIPFTEPKPSTRADETMRRLDCRQRPNQSHHRTSHGTSGAPDEQKLEQLKGKGCDSAEEHDALKRNGGNVKSAIKHLEALDRLHDLGFQRRWPKVINALLRNNNDVNLAVDYCLPDLPKLMEDSKASRKDAIAALVKHKNDWKKAYDELIGQDGIYSTTGKIFYGVIVLAGLSVSYGTQGVTGALIFGGCCIGWEVSIRVWVWLRSWGSPASSQVPRNE